MVKSFVKAVATYVGALYDDIDENYIYVVQRGDSLYLIASKYDTTVMILGHWTI